MAEAALNFRGQTSVLYICPTRALINDLNGRLSTPIEKLGLRLAVRHGDRNTMAGETPAFLVTTPESLDVMLSNSAEPDTKLLNGVRSVIVDEIHQLYGTRRGLQLRILLERLKHRCRRPLQRVLLSATVADPLAVANYFRGSDEPFEIIQTGTGRPISMTLDLLPALSIQDFHSGRSFIELLQPLLRRHGKILVFANTRNECDWLFWKLQGNLDLPVFLHYSSLHKDYREQVESQFRRRRRALCIATSTLELGIDIGDIDLVVLYGPPHTISGFLQRLGRGNRRRGTCLVHGVCRPFHIDGNLADPAEDLLYFCTLVQAALAGKLEQPSEPAFFSVLAQQCFSLSRHHGKVTADLLARYLDPATRGFATDAALSNLLDSLVHHRLLRYQPQHGVYYPDEKLHKLMDQRKIWSNLPSRSLVDVRDERAIPHAQVPHLYASQLSPGDIFLLAGKPRVVTAMNEEGIRTAVLDNQSPALPCYFSAAQPTPLCVAENLADLLQGSDWDGLPIEADTWCRRTAAIWRHKFTELDLENILAWEAQGEQIIYYTFLGSVGNRILLDLLHQRGQAKIKGDAWRITSALPLDFAFANDLTLEDLEGLVRAKLENFARLVQPPPHWKHLPKEQRQQEVISAMALPLLLEKLRDLGSKQQTKLGFAETAHRD
jgi:ATP-dependent Lhr-like helicase